MEFVVLIVLVAVLAFAFVLWWFSSEQVAKRKLKKAVAVPIAEAVEGSLVKITGQLALADTEALAGPLTGRACAGYTVEVQERRRSGKSSHWHTVISTQDTVSFVVEDETGKALVKPHGATLVLVRDAHLSSGFLNDASQRIEEFLASHGRSSEGFLGMNKAMRYKEGVLEPGEEVAVLGLAKWEMDPDPTASEGYRGRAKRLVVDMSDEGTLIVSDDQATLGSG